MLSEGFVFFPGETTVDIATQQGQQLFALHASHFTVGLLVPPVCSMRAAADRLQVDMQLSRGERMPLGIAVHSGIATRRFVNITGRSIVDTGGKIPRRTI